MTLPAVPSLRERLSRDETVFTAWSHIASAHLVGVIAASGYRDVTLDMQHGAHDERSVFDCIEAIRRAGSSVTVRVPVGRWDMVSRALDFGAGTVIAPMINSVEDARTFAAFAKYPPVGQRSWGPARAMELDGDDAGYSGSTGFLSTQNARTLALAMIETKGALAALDDILAVDGIDGVFVGPADLSIALNGGRAVDPLGDAVTEAARAIAAKARAADKVAAIFCVDAARAKDYAAMGFHLQALMTDTGLINAGAASALARARAT
ncbi:MAG: aldolase/citrate lyase family protein [Rhizobiaceae bacterium]|nr:aldolase/citrate lyase family protein [Rhizobiaceae bacterium]